MFYAFNEGFMFRFLLFSSLNRGQRRSFDNCQQLEFYNRAPDVQ